MTRKRSAARSQKAPFQTSSSLRLTQGSAPDSRIALQAHCRHHAHDPRGSAGRRLSHPFTHGDPRIDAGLSILIADKLWYEPSLISFSFMHANRSGMITESSLLSHNTSRRSTRPKGQLDWSRLALESPRIFSQDNSSPPPHRRD